ncbi:hypothetical protein ACN28S_40955 [Cystobacter fuscus]
MRKSWSGLALACALALALCGVLAEAKEARHGGSEGSKNEHTQLLKSFPAMHDPSIRGITELVEFRGDLLRPKPRHRGALLWRSNGTSQGTVLVKQFPAVAGTSISELTVVGGRLYFVADDGEHGAEPWISDGTSQGTRMLEDLTRDPAPRPWKSWSPSGTPCSSCGRTRGPRSIKNCGRAMAPEPGPCASRIWARWPAGRSPSG